MVVVDAQTMAASPAAEMIKLVTIYNENIRDIPAMLRRLADDIEKGEGIYEDVAGVVTVMRHSDYSVEVFGHGEENYDVSIVSLELGKRHLLGMAPF